MKKKNIGKNEKLNIYRKYNMKENNLAEKCPQYNHCNAPLCPLDFEMGKCVYYGKRPQKQIQHRLYNALKGEFICGLAKARIKKIAYHYKDKLPWIFNGRFFKQRTMLKHRIEKF